MRCSRVPRRRCVELAACVALCSSISSCTLDLDLDRYRFADSVTSTVDGGPPVPDARAVGAGPAGDGNPGSLTGPAATLGRSLCVLGSARLGGCVLRQGP